MTGIVLGIIIGLAIAFVRIALRTSLFRSFYKDAYGKTFVCPNCGARFNVKWYRMILKYATVYTYNAAHLRCPVCREKDMCSVAYDER